MSVTETVLDHVVLEVRDPEVSAEFYRALLGFEPVRAAEYRAGEAPFLSARISRGTLLDFFPKPMWRNVRRAENPNHLCFRLERSAVRNLRRRLKRRGIPILRESGASGPRDQTAAGNYGARGYGVSIYFPDPDGITLEAKYYQD